MTKTRLTHGARNATPPMMRVSVFLIALLATGGCVNVTAPEKPIEINLNINVKQEVIVKLQKDAEDFITGNPELFPK